MVRAKEIPNPRLQVSPKSQIRRSPPTNSRSHKRLRIALQFGKQGIMQLRVLFIAAVLFFACRSAVAEPKAYELVKYKGKAEGLIFALDFGDGYPDASEMRVTDRKSGKSTRFGLDDSSEMRFVPEKQGTGKREIVLKMNSNGGPPDKVDGTYTVEGKQTQFTLRRIE